MNGEAPMWQQTARDRFDALLEEIAVSLSANVQGADAQADARKQAAAEGARGQVAASLNQGLRRMREAANASEIAHLSVELSGSAAPRCALFVFRDGAAHAESARGLGALPLTFSPNEGAAFRAAIESRDPVVAVGTTSELSPPLAERVQSETGGGETEERIFLFPLVVRGEVQAILFGAGDVQVSWLELVAGIAALRWEAITAAPVQTRKDLVSIQSVQAEEENGSKPSQDENQTAKRSSWHELPPQVQALHLRAQREARVKIAEMRLQYPDAVRQGLERGDLYTTLRTPIDQAREMFRSEYIGQSPTMVDYLYLELVSGLAHDNERLLGEAFPGPLA